MTRPAPDPSQYDFEKLWVMKVPMWRTFVCLEHSNYDDIIGVPLPMLDQHKARVACGCMVPFNQIAFEFLSGIKSDELQECSCGHLKRFHVEGCHYFVAIETKCACEEFVLAQKR